MRVIIDINPIFHFKRITGTERYMLELVSCLRRMYPEEIIPSGFLLRRKHFLSGLNTIEKEFGKCRLLHLPSVFVSMLNRIGLGLDYLFFDADIIHSFKPDEFFLKKKKKVLTVLDLSFEREKTWHTEDNYKRCLKYRRLCREADRIFALSDFTKREIVELYGIREEKISVIYGAAAEIFKPAEINTYPAECGLNEYVLSVGTIEPRKNILTLLEAMRLVWVKKPGLKLVIAGRKGWSCGIEWAEIKKEEQKGRVKYLEYVSDEKLVQLYSFCSVFASLSFYEGFNMPLVESMACGSPVVASDIPVHREVTGGAGFLVPVSDASAAARALLNITVDYGLQQKMKAEALIRSSYFSFKKSAEKTYSEYVLLCEKASGRF